jgi:predicted nucleic acid-binding protein
MVADDAVTLTDIGVAEVGQLKALMQKYRDLSIDFADAALVHAAERAAITQIVTFDRHFAVYRLSPRRRFTILPSPG